MAFTNSYEFLLDHIGKTLTAEQLSHFKELKECYDRLKNAYDELNDGYEASENQNVAKNEECEDLRRENRTLISERQKLYTEIKKLTEKAKELKLEVNKLEKKKRRLGKEKASLIKENHNVESGRSRNKQLYRRAIDLISTIHDYAKINKCKTKESFEKNIKAKAETLVDVCDTCGFSICRCDG